ncbi:hypothetical protein GPJ56_006168 [Histomonas meleagridis]|uniref:uncharacterized protein n=1 Tax=Histomonas meleagridis TaxID=135588 RepID=UPI0035595D24|nr:hypothetical protein GPJ56_006168 [Histomonas meleagridis]KAH0797016.1 hypothetical protein GO595_010909 [Histomonas meleagridis]
MSNQNEPTSNDEDNDFTLSSTDTEEDKRGFLVYIFTGDQDPAEIEVFRKICMKYSLQSWDEMMKYLPWRNRAALRTTLCKIIRKQSVSEYDGIRADPYVIRKDNLALGVSEDGSDEEYTIKGNILVNLKWDRKPEEWEAMRIANTKKYMISDEEADKIEIPSIISIEHMSQQIANRRQSLLLYRAAIINEIAKRKKVEPKFDVKELCIVTSDHLDTPTNTIKLESKNSNDFYFPISDEED